jgi:hypothetical protein
VIDDTEFKENTDLVVHWSLNVFFLEEATSLAHDGDAMEVEM